MTVEAELLSMFCGLDGAEMMRANEVKATETKRADKVKATDAKRAAKVEATEAKRADRVEATEMKRACKVEATDVKRADEVGVTDTKRADKAEATATDMKQLEVLPYGLEFKCEPLIHQVRVWQCAFCVVGAIVVTCFAGFSSQIWIWQFSHQFSCGICDCPRCRRKICRCCWCFLFKIEVQSCFYVESVQLMLWCPRSNSRMRNSPSKGCRHTRGGEPLPHAI